MSRPSHTSFRPFLLACLAAWAAGCAPERPDSTPGTGGTPGSGGGTSPTGGAPAAGGTVGSGGANNAGGAASTGGAVGTGGATGTGGFAATGGVGIGGAGSGGAVNTGGMGGRGGTGGAAGRGGSAATGGSGIAGAGSGGATNTGGMGGRAGTGGAGTGGTGTGGATQACGNIASTATRPQLSSTDAANNTIARYFAQPDVWDPTAGLGDAASFTANATVAADGSGTHTTVQAALSASTGSARSYILIKPGTYREIVSYTGSTPVTLYGAMTDATRVIIVNNRSASDAGGTSASATFTVKSAGFQMMNLTVSNDFATPASGSNIQAVALYTTGDKTVLQNVRMHGFQDTFYVDSSSATTVARVYLKSCFIEGDTDYIFGRATAVFDGCTLQYLSSRKGTGSGVYMAPSTSVDNNYGFLFIRCSFTADASAPANKISLGRSWDTSSTTPTPNGQGVVRESTLGAHINRTSPWAAAATSGRAFSATGNRFGEYCNNGPGAAP